MVATLGVVMRETVFVPKVRSSQPNKTAERITLPLTYQVLKRCCCTCKHSANNFHVQASVTWRYWELPGHRNVYFLASARRSPTSFQFTTFQMFLR
jgi:hypothetical protein